MSREWKPGDVAMRVGPNGAEKLAVCVAGGCTTHIGADAHWHTVSKTGRADWDTLAYEGVSYRPLVVIDPENREQVEALRSQIFEHTGIGHREFDRVQAALREFADPKPPKPAEPTGLGAVVEDAAGGRWLRVAAPDLGGGVWIGEVFNGCGDPQSTQYDNVPAVRVLSEGVTP